MKRGISIKRVNVPVSNGNQKYMHLAPYSSIEPLNALHLAGLARDLGWDRRIHLVRDHNYEDVREVINEYKPDVLGVTLFTGNQEQAFEGLKPIKRDHPNMKIVAGGYHPTYFPQETIDEEAIDYVVMSEGFGALEKILKGEAKPGILPMQTGYKFPFPDRETFYKYYAEHAKSFIKSMITMTGCPYSCTYCYNSSQVNDLNLPPNIAQQLALQMSLGGRLFPSNHRDFEDVLREGKDLSEKWPTRVIYFQDDIFGFDDKKGGFLDKMNDRWMEEVGIPFHGQMRWEMTKSERRLELIRESGGFGLTFAIESSIPIVRKEILDRDMKDDLVLNGMEKVKNLGYNIRTEQIGGLPLGTTSEPSLINLDADIDLIRYNRWLKEEANGPDMAWASTYAPYNGTKSGIRSREEGFRRGDPKDNNVPDTFFEHSVLYFLKDWIGRDIESRKNSDDIWLNEGENERYRTQNGEWRKKFNFFVEVPEGDILAKHYLSTGWAKDFESKKGISRPELEVWSYEKLGRDTENHLMEMESRNKRAREILSDIKELRMYANNLIEEERVLVNDLAPYFAVLPKNEQAVHRFLEYGRKRGGYTAGNLSDATRHHLYDKVLYFTGECEDDDRIHEVETHRQSSLKV